MGLFGQHTHAQSIQLELTTALVEVKFNFLLYVDQRNFATTVLV